MLIFKEIKMLSSTPATHPFLSFTQSDSSTSTVYLSQVEQDLLNNFIKTVMKERGIDQLPLATQQSLKEKINNSIIKSLKENLSQDQFIKSELKEIANKIDNGGIDILSEQSHSDIKLRVYIKENPRDFCQFLLAKAQSKASMEYWVGQGLQFPEDVLNLAIFLKSSKPVFEFLNEKGCLDNIGERERDRLLDLAYNSLQPKAFEYLKENFYSRQECTM